MVDEAPDTSSDSKKLGIAKAVVSAIPMLGGPAAELLDLAIRPQIEKRQVDWLNSVAKGLVELEERIERFEVASLVDDAAFTSAMLQASSIAIRNHNEEKLAALRNAILNTAVSTTVDEDEEVLLLALIDTFTPWHLRLLAFFAGKEDVARQRDKLPFPTWTAGGVSTVLEYVYPEMANRRSFYDLVVSDLNRSGLITIDTLHITGTRDGYMLAKQTSDFGDRLLAFIAEPEAVRDAQ